MAMRRIETTLTGAEAARVTGIDELLQRELRARGFLHVGWGKGARIGFMDACRLYALRRCLDAGISGPADPSEFGPDMCVGLCVLPMMHFADVVMASREGRSSGPWVGTSHSSHDIGRYVIVSDSSVSR